MELVKVVKEYIKKDGSKGKSTNFYIVLDNGNRVEVRPVDYEYNNEKVSNYKELSLIARSVER